MIFKCIIKGSGIVVLKIQRIYLREINPRQAHNLKAARSNRAPATKSKKILNNTKINEKCKSAAIKKEVASLTLLFSTSLNALRVDVERVKSVAAGHEKAVAM